MLELRDRALAWAKTDKKCYINGVWRTSPVAQDVIDPFTQNPIASVAVSDRAMVDEAVDAASRAFHGAWSALSRKERATRLQAAGQVLRQNAGELAAIISLENGKTYLESLEDDMPDTSDVFDYYAGWIDKHYGETAPVESGFLNYIVREPLGVCGLIVPWNFPLLLAAWKLAAALAMGNTIVIKPSELTPLSLIRAVELWDEAGIFPPGVINLVCGAGATGAVIAEHLGIAKVSFTGSTGTGKRIVQASGSSNLKSLTLELGGKAPVVIFDDLPDLESAIDRCFHVAFSHKGEKCTEPTRLIIQERLYQRFTDGLKARAQGRVCGDPFLVGVAQGPQCGRAQFEKVADYIDAGIASGATLLVGGPVERDGAMLIPPVIFGDADPAASIATDEIFGPVLVLHRFSTEKQAIELANDTPYGLAAGLYTSDLSRAHRVAKALDAGQVFVNRYGCYDFASPFGGFKQSGWGKEMGRHSLDAWTKAKSVWIAHGD